MTLLDIMRLVKKGGGGGSISLQAKMTTPTKSQQDILADDGYDGLSKVTVEPIPSQYIVPTGSITIDAGGTYDVTEAAQAVVDVPGPQSVLTGTDAPTKLTIGNLPTVRQYGLYHHDTIQELHLPDTKQLSMYALSASSALKILDIPKATLLSDFALANCTALQSLNAPSLTTITSNTFNGCSAIETLNLPSLTKITSTISVFNGCSNLKSLRMPKLQRTGETQSNVFRSCSKLVSADVGHVIRLNSASGSVSLTGLNVPATLKLIALRYSGIVTLSAAFNANSPLTLGTGFVLVPRDNISEYQVATNWATLYNAGTQFLAIEDYTVDGTTEGVLDEDKIDALLAS